MATLTWGHAVQFVNQPEAAVQVLSGQKLNALAGEAARVGDLKCAELFRSDLDRISGDCR